MSEKNTGLAQMREPFNDNQICKLPKPTKAQTDAVKKDFKKGARCVQCGGWHHPKVVHLDYVGHAALTDRLLDVDPLWSWEPLSFDEKGLPLIDGDGGMWIKLTVCGVTRFGYGDASGKSGGNAMKERIGDALRNAAMRFGAALDLWHKGELHGEDTTEEERKEEPETVSLEKFETAINWFVGKIQDNEKTVADLEEWFASKEASIPQLNEVDQHKVMVCYRENLGLVTENQQAPKSESKLEMDI